MLRRLKALKTFLALSSLNLSRKRLMSLLCLMFIMISFPKNTMAESAENAGTGVASANTIAQSIISTAADSKIGTKEDQDSDKNTKKDDLVDQSGALNYKFPLNIPEGTNNLAPELTLAYDSNVSNNMMGMGWYIKGIPVIKRDFTYGVNYDSNDKFTYNGEKLIRTSDGCYHPRKETYERIEYNTSLNCWIVTQKNGTKYYYGYTSPEHFDGSDGRIQEVGRPSHILLWSLSKVVDIHGNYYIIEYNEDAADGDFYPVRITYTKNEKKSLPSVRTIEFSYENRMDHYIVYSPTKMDMDRRLKWITVKMGSNLLRKWRLDYEYSQGTDRSRLTGIQEYGCDGNTPPVPWVDESFVGTGKVLPRTHFKWQDGPFSSFSSVYSQRGIGGFDLLSESDKVFSFDYNGNGVSDLCLYRPYRGEIAIVEYQRTTGRFEAAYYAMGYGSDNWGIGEFTLGDQRDRILPFDYNGDGRGDLCAYRPGTGKIYIITKSGGIWKAVNKQENGMTGYDLKSNNDQIFSLDYNGDGLSDLCLYRPGSGAICIAKSNGDGTFKSVYFQGGGGSGIAGFDLKDAQDRIFPFDYNGDGKSDMCLYRPGYGAICIARSNGDGTFSKVYLSGSGIEGFDLKGWEDEVFPFDYNGDGKDDLCLSRDNYARGQKLCILRSNGDGTFSKVLLSDNGVGIIDFTYMDIFPFDYNGDGKDDLCLNYAGTGAICIAKSQGDGTFSPAYLQGSGGSGIAGFDLKEYQDIVLTYDYNGDGDSDLFLRRLGGPITIADSNGGNPDLLAEVDNGNEGTIKISYLPAPQDPNAVYPILQQYPNIANSSPTPLVTKIQLNDGLGHVVTDNYFYSNGMVHIGQPFERFNLGFDVITKQNDLTGIIRTYYRKDDLDLRLMVDKEEVWGGIFYGGEKLYTKKQYEYEKHPNGSESAINFIHVKNEYTDNYNGDGCLNHWDEWIPDKSVQYRTEYDYDDYGNLKFQKNYGDTSVTGDEEWTVNQYIYFMDSSKYLYLPSVEQKYGIKLDGYEGLATETRFYYDSNYNLEHQELENGETDVTNKFGYDVYGNISSKTDGKGNTTTFIYDNQYQTFLRYEALKYTTETIYDDLMRPVKRVDENGQVWLTVYDEFSRERALINPGDTTSAPTIQATYPEEFLDSSGAPLFPRRRKIAKKVTDGNYIDSYTYYDGLDRAVQEKTEAKEGWITVDHIYDNGGRECKTSVPYFTSSLAYSTPDGSVKWKSYQFDPIGRLEVVTNPDLTTIKTIYDVKDKYSTFTIDPLGHVTNKRVEGNMEYNINYSGVYPSYTEYSKTTTINACDGVKTIDATGKNEFITYKDLLGRTVKIVNPVSGTWSFGYDANNNMTSQTDAKNQTLTFEFDLMNRMTKKIYPNGKALSFYYDEPDYGYSKGRLTQAVHGRGSKSYTYDERGRQTVVSQMVLGKSRTKKIAYNSQDQLVSQTYPDGEVVSYLYDNGGQLTEVKGASSYLTDAKYYANGKVSKLFYGNGVETDYDYYDTSRETDNTAGTNYSYRLKRIRAFKNSDILDLRYEYDKTDNVKVKQDLINASYSEQYDYDDLNRLTGANSTSYGNKTFRYDTLNNIIEKDNRTYQYDTNNPYKLLNDGRFSYTYDANGSISSRSDGMTIAWDYNNRVNSISDTSYYAYNTDGERICKQVGNVETDYFFNDYEEVYQGGTKIKSVKYYFADKLRIAENASTTGIRYYHKDHLGSSTVVTDTSGNLVKRIGYTPYGTESVSTGTADVTYKFTDKEMDNTGFYFFGARYYDPEMGRFISVDPARDGDNWYAYCNDNPVKFIDPTGKYTIYRSGVGRTNLVNIKNGDLKSGTLFKVKMEFSDPLWVALGIGADLFATKKIQAALDANDLAQDLLIKGNVEGAITTLAKSMHEDLNNILSGQELLAALTDTAVKSKFERLYGEGSAGKYYTARELKDKLRTLFDKSEMKILEDKVKNAEFSNWWEGWVADYLDTDYDDWFDYDEWDGEF